MCQRSAWFAMSLHTPSHQVTLLQTHEITHTHIYIYKENLINNIFKRAPSFSFRVGTRDDTKVAAEYCWAITQTARALMRGPIPFQRFASNFGWTPLYTHTHTHTHRQLTLCTHNSDLRKIQIASDLPDRQPLRKLGSVHSATRCSTTHYSDNSVLYTDSPPV